MEMAKEVSQLHQLQESEWPHGEEGSCELHSNASMQLETFTYIPLVPRPKILSHQISPLCTEVQASGLEEYTTWYGKATVTIWHYSLGRICICFSSRISGIVLIGDHLMYEC